MVIARGWGEGCRGVVVVYWGQSQVYKMRALRGWTVAMAARHYGCFKTSELYAETVKMVNFMLCVFYYNKKKLKKY